MKTRSIEKIVKPGTPHFVGDGFRVHNFIPGSSSMQRMDPFIMLDYNSKYNFPPTDKPKGVGVHPHRGFETVTIAYKGRVEHGDSAGGGGIIGEGDVQWMTAASGVLHKEFHETEWSKTGGEFQMVQLWVNLPAKDKMSSPKYQAITNAEMAKIQLPDGVGEVEVIAGEYKGNKGPASTFSPVNMFNVKLKKGAKTQLTFPAHYTTAILAVEGSVKVNESNNVLENHFALFKNDGDTITLEALEDAVILVLSGEPLNEPIAAHGPFVMNTKQELIEAFQDFNTGKFGYLED
ncbi:pirin family protein [uncultured Tenacibaculum sp.]|uniref:pirin family protein n=1 Tax=uncultured Tenacibaculum sp. TaxID=174713 RepID=UPI00262E7DC4|nr:pirin family protein [uncultured Tenacibaculum sp.]